jgi:hypothetical protein
MSAVGGRSLLGPSEKLASLIGFQRDREGAPAGSSAVCFGFPKRDIRALLRQYAALADDLRANVPLGVFDTIVHTDHRAKLQRLEQWVRSA